MSQFPQAYLICGTPRSGSTLICEMLYRSGVAGRPNSYFREVDIAHWAEDWGVSPAEGIDTPAFDRAYLAAMREAGRAGTGIFGLRVMYSSLADAGRRLARVFGRADTVPAQLEAAFGPLLYIHLSRGDKLGQAVSLVRAEQTGLWHLNADGSVLEGAEERPEPVYDGQRIAAVLADLEADDRAWDAFFAGHGITPLRLIYEGVTATPQRALAEIFARLGLDEGIALAMAVPTAKMADATSREWVERFRRENA
ncbi:Stf0 family sulfotransferase [Devosia sp.]|uniref:Stf0 family sulfotransferase n=1 Tax=Devosia sp. TaxID=1871048 RepID=UPI001B22DDFF|nr:Stf0 family sulfotransferase [Devosia sp.]MBO9590594.1 Stf0 sulfotransferase [Devosia sp.]